MNNYFTYLIIFFVSIIFNFTSAHGANITIYCPPANTILVSRQSDCDPHTNPACSYLYKAHFYFYPDDALALIPLLIGQGDASKFYHFAGATLVDHTFACSYATNDVDQIIFSMNLHSYVTNCGFFEERNSAQCNGTTLDDCPLWCDLIDK